MKPKDNQEDAQPTAKIESTGVHTRKCTVYLLNGQEFQCNVERNANGGQLLRQIRELLDIIEFDYFGLYFEDSTQHRYWLEEKKSIKKQLKNSPWKFNLAVKFFPSDPSQLSENMSRYYMVLQLRENIVTGSLPCSFVTHALLGSFIVQSELGDYDPASMTGNHYVGGFRFAPNQTSALEEKVVELHKTHKGLTPEEAEIAFLENVKKLTLYGVDQHAVKDSENIDLMLGVSWNGLRVYRDQVQINRFGWPRILKISYVRSKFYIRIRPVDDQVAENIVGFKLPNHRAAKKLWKSAVEHHTFFRLTRPEIPKNKLMRTGSKFRYAGQTQHQTRQIVATSTRKTVPKIQRTASRRSYSERTHKPSTSDSVSPPELPKKERAATTTTEVVTITEETVTEKIKVPPKTEIVEVTTVEETVETQGVEMKPTEEGAPASTGSSSSSLSSMSDGELDALTKHQKKVHKMKTKSDCEKTNAEDEKFLQEPPPGSTGSSEWDVRLLSSSPSKNGNDDGPSSEPHTEREHTNKEEVTVVTTVTTEVVKEVVTTSRGQESSSSSSEDEEVIAQEAQPGPLPDFVPVVEPESSRRSSSSSSSSEEEVVEKEDSDQEDPAKGDVNEEPKQDDEVEIQEEEEEIVIENPYAEDEPAAEEEKEEVEDVNPEEVETSSTSSESASSESGAEELKHEEDIPEQAQPLELEEEVNENNNNNEVLPEQNDDADDEDEDTDEIIISQNIITTVETKSVRVEDVVIPREDNEVRKVALTADQDNNVTVLEARSTSSYESSSSSDSEDETGAGDAEPVFGEFKKPPIVETEAVYVEPAEAEEPAITTEPPVVQTETRTITYESSQHQPDVVNATNDVQLLSSQTITAETMSSVTTTHITKTVVGSVSETRVEKSIVITADGDADLHQAMAEAIKDTQESQPDVSITRVVVHEQKVVENP